jgi:hypothetical protein
MSEGKTPLRRRTSEDRDWDTTLTTTTTTLLKHSHLLGNVHHSSRIHAQGYMRGWLAGWLEGTTLVWQRS